LGLTCSGSSAVSRNKKRKRQTADDPPIVIPDLYRLTYSRGIAAKGGEDELVPRLISQFIPTSIVHSLSLALDPFYRFRVSPVKIAPVNRTRTQVVRSALGKRKTVFRSTGSATTVTWTFGNGCRGDVATGPSELRSEDPLPDVVDVWRKTKDTTRRTRLAGYEFGEYEHQEFTSHSPTRNASRTQSGVIYGPSTCEGRANTSVIKYKQRTENVGDAASIPLATVQSFLDSERDLLASTMQKKILGMMPKALPERRHFNLIREIVELRDVPRAMIQLRSTLENFGHVIKSVPQRDVKRFITNLKINAKDVPKEYVGFHFGWKQIYKAIKEALEAPQKITSDINRIIERKGKPTTFRYSMKLPVDGGAPPEYEYPSYRNFAYNMDEVVKAKSTTCTREVQLKLAINAIFDFPTLGVPELRHQLWVTKLGANPTPMDLYNLTPWSWLVDWFTGMGDYLGAIQYINSDRSTFNYGFLTGHLRGQVKTVLDTLLGSEDRVIFLPPFPYSDSDIWWSPVYTHTSVLEYRVTLRKNIVQAYELKSLASGGLSTYQNSIIGAILADRHLKSIKRP